LFLWPAEAMRFDLLSGFKVIGIPLLTV